MVIAIMAVSMFSAYIALNSSAIFARQKTIGTELATNQLEYLKSLPYDNLAVDGGAIPHPSPLPNTDYQTIDTTEYEIKTSINYVDDAFDGCANYPNEATKNLLCRNLPSPAAAPATDLNPADYKIANIKVFVNSKQVAELDTQIAARVAETDSTTGALVVTVIDSAGNPVSGATVNVNNSSVAPAIDVNDSTDSNGVAVFYGLTPDTGNDYEITASKTAYSTLSTIKPVGGLSPNFASQNIIFQQSSSVTLTIDPMGQYSLITETFDTNNSPLSNMSVYIKGGPKKFSDAADTSYYYDNNSPTDDRPESDTNGIITLQNLTPGSYFFCGDNGSTGCAIGGSTYYLVAAVPYAGPNQFEPIGVPTYTAANPPSPTFTQGGSNYYQKVRLFFSTNSNHPRITSLQNSTASKAAGSHTFTVIGENLPCHPSDPGLCGTQITVKNTGGNMTASCVYADLSTTELNCTINASGADTGQSNIELSANGFTFDIPNGSGLLGGINVTP
jgi:hypothetical protein